VDIRPKGSQKKVPTRTKRAEEGKRGEGEVDGMGTCRRKLKTS